MIKNDLNDFGISASDMGKTQRVYAQKLSVKKEEEELESGKLSITDIDDEETKSRIYDTISDNSVLNRKSSFINGENGMKNEMD